MSSRSHGRTNSQTRPLTITTDFVKTAYGSALVEYGETKVICTASVEDHVPGWMRGQRGRGWLTAEYALLPASTLDRSKRERQKISGRSQEIQRLIGRAVRGIIDLGQIGERTITLDCDVLQADGGTRTASITGCYVALKMCIERMIQDRKIPVNPLKEAVAGVSVGIVNGNLLVDLDYEEDLHADVDMNVVMTSSGKLLEVQGTAEKQSFSIQQLNDMVSLAQNAMTEIFNEQNLALERAE